LAFLKGHGVPVALIGAGALAAHGIARSTLDHDLLTTDHRVLDGEFWRPPPRDADVDVRRGDATDPLLGVVRLHARSGRDVDIVVGRHAWQEGVLERAELTGVEGARVPVATPADLVLLKLFAGGSQDAWDIEQVLDRVDAEDIARIVDERLALLPADARALWTRIRDTRRRSS
jgi:hypothetical protein